MQSRLFAESGAIGFCMQIAGPVAAPAGTLTSAQESKEVLDALETVG